MCRMSDQGTTTEQEGIWCVVANVKGERPSGPGGTTTRSGTRQFRAGTKVYIAGCYAGTCDGVVAIGLHRHSRRFITCVVDVCHVEQFRAKVAYHPRVLELIRQDSRCWIRTKEEAEQWAAAFPQWQRIWQKATMTESDWLTSTDLPAMFRCLRSRTSNRKMRLFSCACCRRILGLLSECSRQIIVVAERFADGLSSEDERLAGRQVPSETSADAASRAALARSNEAMEAAAALASAAAGTSEELEQTLLLRDVVGNPFYPVEIDRSWLSRKDGTVVKLAEAIYNDRSFDRLPILADALEEAGCMEPAILEHCRGPGPHVRGCWVVDLLLGKE